MTLLNKPCLGLFIRSTIMERVPWRYVNDGSTREPSKGENSAKEQL